MILKSSLLCHSNTLTHKDSFPFVSSYCFFFWSTVRTASCDKKTKERSWTRDMLLDRSGSQLRVSITVSHHSDWWLSLLHTKELPRRQTSKLNTSSTLNTTHITTSTKTSATWFCFSYFTLIKWHLLVVVRWSVSAPRVMVSYAARRGQTDTATVRAEVGSRLLLKVDGTATSTLRGWLQRLGDERWRLGDKERYWDFSSDRH